MKELDLHQVKEKFSELTSDIVLSDWEYLQQKIIQLWKFIETQPILKNAIDRITKDFSDVLELAKSAYSGYEGPTSGYLIKIHDREDQGIFGYYLIKMTVEITNSSNPWIRIIQRFHRPEKYHRDSKDDFIELIFNPFIELVDSYLEIRNSDSIQDHFTIDEANEIHDKLDEILERLEKLELLPIGQEVIFNEVDELKELTKSLKKKNWIEILKGKLFDLVINQLISIETFKLIISNITGEDIKFLEK